MYKELIEKMTIEEKAQILSGADTWHTHGIERLGIPVMSLSDGPSGLRKQAGEGDHLGLNASTKATCVPSASTLANSWSCEVTEQVGALVGADAKAQDVHVLLGPGINVKRSPLCGRSFEYYSEDPYLAGKLSAGFIRGVQSNNVSACVKHFAANSQEHLRMSNDSVMDERTLREMYLTNFEIAVKEGKPGCLMTSYNRVNGTYANENKHLLGDILRGEWGFDGMVVTDWGGSNSYIEGVREGMNLEMPAAGDDSALQLVEAVKKGVISEEIVNERVEQLLKMVMSANKGKTAPVDEDEAHKKVLKAMEECIVLLKNEDNILPVLPDKKVAVIGDFAFTPRYQGAGSSMVNAARLDETLKILPDFYPKAIGFAKGFERLDHVNEHLVNEAVELAKEAEIVLLYLGLPEGFETEGLDRTHMRIPENQINLLKKVSEVNSNVAVILSAGSAVEMPWIENCKALVYAGLGGQAAATAVLKVVSGEVNPSGKLSETFALEYDDMPVSKYYPGYEATSEYREGLFVGYRYFTTAKKPVRFPFGFGLSYTSFEYSNLCVTDKGVTFDIENTGFVDGMETAQLYIALPGAKVYRPAMELKGFTKIALKAGEKKTAQISFDEYTFRYFDTDSNKWEVEAGEYSILIGASSQDIRLEDKLKVEGKNCTSSQDSLRSYYTGNVTAVSDEEFKLLLGHEIPKKMWDKGAPLTLNDTVRQMTYAKNPAARFGCKILTNMVNKAIANGKPDLNLLFIYNITFRGMAKMMGGMVTMQMAEDIVFLCNGHWHKGLFRLIKHFIKRPTLNK